MSARAFNLRRDRKGFTIVEVIIVVSLVGMVIALGAGLLSKTASFLHRFRARETAIDESRKCIDMIRLQLSHGRAGSLVISTPAGSATPYSRADFGFFANLHSGATSYAIWLDRGTVYTQEFAPGGARAARPLARHVSALSFGGDSTDPSQVKISLRIDVPWDQAKPEHVSTVLMPDEIVRMMELP